MKVSCTVWSGGKVREISKTYLSLYIVSASRAAIKGGFTTITCQPDTNPSVDNKTVVNYIKSTSAQKSLVNIYPYGSMSVDCKGEVMAEIGEMVKAGIVGVSDGGNSISDSFLMRNILLYLKMFDIPAITTCSDNSISRKGVMNSGNISTSIGLNGIHREAEEIIVARNLILAKYVNARLHISSVSTAGSVQLIRDAKIKGINVTCETQPQYFTLTEDNVRGYNTLAKVNPPLRTACDIEEIKKGIVDGTIDIISSGHTPNTFESKQKEFDVASFGISSLETAFYISYKYLVETVIIIYCVCREICIGHHFKTSKS